MVERAPSELPLTLQAALLGLSRSSLYYRPVPPSPEEVALKHRIDEIYTAHPYYGSRRIGVVLRQEGQAINRKAVQRPMQEMGLAGVAPGPHTSRRHPTHPVYPYLLRQLTATHPNHVWGIDITYVRLQAGWLYLVAVLDWYTRYVVAWELDQTLEVGFVLEAVDRALAALSVLGEPATEVWMPRWTFATQEAQARVEQEIDRILASATSTPIIVRSRGMSAFLDYWFDMTDEYG